MKTNIGLAGLILAALVIASTSGQAVRRDHGMTLVDVTGLADGDYVIHVRGGTVNVHPARIITPDDPGPNPNPPPGPSPLTERGIKVRDAAAKVTGDVDRDTTAKGMAILYRELGKQVTSGKLTGDNIIKVLAASTDMLLETRKVKPAWQPVRDVVTTEWSRVAQSGGRDADYAKLLNECADGYDASAPAKQISPEFWAFILEIIKIIMALLVKP